MSVSATTLQKLALGVGTALIGGTDVGATSKEGEFKVEQEIYWPELGGTLGPIAGTGIVTSETATLTLTLKELAMTKLVWALPDLTQTSDASSEYTLRPNVGGAVLGVSLHKDVIWVGTTIDAKTILIKLFNTLADNGLTLNLADGAESEYELVLKAYQVVADPKQRAWQLMLQK
jgi:hypothetical protein